MKFNEMRKSLSPKQEKLARLFQAHEITSYSKAVKALATQNNEQVQIWKTELDAQLNPEPILEVIETATVSETVEEQDYEYPFQAVNAAKEDPWARVQGYYIVRKVNGRFDYGYAGHGKLEAGEEIWH